MSQNTYFANDIQNVLDVALTAPKGSKEEKTAVDAFINGVVKNFSGEYRLSMLRLAASFCTHEREDSLLYTEACRHLALLSPPAKTEATALKLG